MNKLEFKKAKKVKIIDNVHHRNEHLSCESCLGKPPKIEPLNLKDFTGEKCTCLKILWWKKR